MSERAKIWFTVAGLVVVFLIGLFGGHHHDGGQTGRVVHVIHVVHVHRNR